MTLRTATLAACLAVLVAGCSIGDESAVPGSLADGRPAATLTVALEGVEQPIVTTAVNVVQAQDVAPGSRAGTCLASRPETVGPRSAIVSRMGAKSESVTFRDATGRSLVACDDTPEPSAAGAARPWCGSAHGTLFDGRLRDPRLDLGCKTSDGSSIGILWIEPAPTTSYVAVEQPGFVEVYAIAAGLPVRVATADVELEGSRATAAISEHDDAGDLVRRYRLEASVAG